MKFQEIRSATAIITFGGVRFLLDPWLGEKGSIPPIPGSPNPDLRCPVSDLPLPISEILKVDAVIATHLHFDHTYGVAELKRRTGAEIYGPEGDRYMLDNDIRPDMLPGSIYGAIGLCQFMPSNIRPYGMDGNGDGVINLYVADDAVASLANYLARHGWKATSSKSARHRVLMRYNKSTVYANTILALADRIDRLGGKPARTAAGSR